VPAPEEDVPQYRTVRGEQRQRLFQLGRHARRGRGCGGGGGGGAIGLGYR
jgi:hypothetical protein